VGSEGEHPQGGEGRCGVLETWIRSHLSTQELLIEDSQWIAAGRKVRRNRSPPRLEVQGRSSGKQGSKERRSSSTMKTQAIDDIILVGPILIAQSRIGMDEITLTPQEITLWESGKRLRPPQARSLLGRQSKGRLGASAGTNVTDGGLCGTKANM